MIGAIIYKLQAMNNASLIELHGKLLHGALFKIIEQIDSEASQFIHDEAGSKGFSAGLLDEEFRLSKGRDMHIVAGNYYRWRVCGLNSRMLRLLQSVPVYLELTVGKATFRITEVINDGRYDSGVIEKENIITRAMNMKKVRSVTFSFVTAATFRRDNMDYPMPTPELVFGSIARKWQENEMPLEIDLCKLRDVAWHVKPFKWEGKSIFGYTAKGWGITGFKGTYTYSFDDIEDDWCKVFLMLGMYAVYAGVGRLTGQGFGVVKFSWR